MSRLAMQWAIELDPDVHDITSTQLIVLVALAYHFNDETGRCNPSYDTIAQRARLSRRAAINAITALAEAGLVTTTESRTKHNRVTSNQFNLPAYRTSSARRAPLNTDSAVQRVHPSTDSGVHDVPSRGAPDALSGVHEVHPNQEVNQEGNLTRASAHATPSEQPSPFCPAHPGGTSVPCAACGEARKTAAKWERDRRAQSKARRASWPIDPRTGVPVRPHAHDFRGPEGTCIGAPNCGVITDEPPRHELTPLGAGAFGRDIA